MGEKRSRMVVQRASHRAEPWMEVGTSAGVRSGHEVNLRGEEPDKQVSRPCPQSS